MPIAEIRVRMFYSSTEAECVPSISGKFDTDGMDTMDFNMLIRRMVEVAPSSLPMLSNVREMTIGEVNEFLENEAQSVSVHNPRAKETAS